MTTGPVRHSGPAAPADEGPERPAVLGELAVVRHWRRLVRARMDLAVASVSSPRPLGRGLAGVLPSGAVPGLAAHLALLEAVSTGGPEGEIDRLEQLRALDRRLARYESALGDVVAGDAAAATPAGPAGRHPAP